LLNGSFLLLVTGHTREYTHTPNGYLEPGNAVAHTVHHVSKLVLPVIPNPPQPVPAALPRCGSLRGQPCRATLGNGEATGVDAGSQRKLGAIVRHRAHPRPGDTLTGYDITAQPGGTTMHVGPTVTRVRFPDLDPGSYDFVVSALYDGDRSVSSTPSQTVR